MSNLKHISKALNHISKAMYFYSKPDASRKDWEIEVFYAMGELDKITLKNYEMEYTINEEEN